MRPRNMQVNYIVSYTRSRRSPPSSSERSEESSGGGAEERGGVGEPITQFVHLEDKDLLSNFLLPMEGETRFKIAVFKRHRLHLFAWLGPKDSQMKLDQLLSLVDWTEGPGHWGKDNWLLKKYLFYLFDYVEEENEKLMDALKPLTMEQAIYQRARRAAKAGQPPPQDYRTMYAPHDRLIVTYYHRLQEQCIINLGSLTGDYDESLYVIFRENRGWPFKYQRWNLMGYCKQSDALRRLPTAVKLPPAPIYFKRREDLYLLPLKEIDMNEEHILKDEANWQRLVKHFAKDSATPMPADYLREMVLLAMARAKRAVTADPSIAIPHHYRDVDGNGHMQFLLPLYFPHRHRLSRDTIPDMVAALEPQFDHGEVVRYFCYTLLDMTMAYSNARQIKKIRHHWMVLHKVDEEARDEQIEFYEDDEEYETLMSEADHYSRVMVEEETKLEQQHNHSGKNHHAEEEDDYENGYDFGDTDGKEDDLMSGPGVFRDSVDEEEEEEEENSAPPPPSTKKNHAVKSKFVPKKNNNNAHKA